VRRYPVESSEQEYRITDRSHFKVQTIDDVVSAHLKFFVNFGDGNWRQAEAWIVLLGGTVVVVNALAQGALRQFTSDCGSNTQPSNW